MGKIFWQIFSKEIEFNRQVTHLFFGLFYALFFALGYIDFYVSLFLLTGSVLLSLWYKKRRTLWDKFILLLEREENLSGIPLKGLISFLAGLTVTIAVFDFVPALAGIVVLSVTDSIGTLYGKYMGRVKVKWNEEKHLEGPVVGGFLSAILCYSFLPLMPALMASYSGALIDTLKIRILGVSIDDNLLIPIVAAGIVEFMV